MSELALYRKYRSSTFDEVVGQEHVVSTLKQALAAKRVSHAYLFTGPRGVGKTSVARLLAHGLNPEVDAASGGLDIIEIDAASNRSIDAVRDLRDKINLAPSVGAFKVYIIDEVHMLTSEAFNALLKTLEEPPAHAVFILATTEAHKVPETIISRTQRFSFKPIVPTDLIGHLQNVAKSENITIEPEALDIIAGAARGSFRDALSMLDQVAGDRSQTVTAESVRLMLGYSDSETLGALGQAVVDGQTKEVLLLLDRLVASGVQPTQLITQCAEWWRSLLLAAAGTQSATDPVITSLAKTVPLSRIAAVIERLIEAGRSQWPLLSLEVTLVKLTALDDEEASAPAPIRSGKVQAPAKRSAADSQGASGAPKKAPASSDDRDPVDLWPKVLMAIKTQNNPLFALLQKCRVEFDEDTIVIWSNYNFHRDRMMEAKSRTVIERCIEKVYGHNVPFTGRVDAGARTARDLTPAGETDELISSALDILGGEVME